MAPSVAELAARRPMRACLDWFRRERAWINEQHLKLCRIAAPTFFEEARAKWMVEQFAAVGWNARLDRAGNVLATRPEATGLPLIAVTAHLDTVLAPRTAADIKSLGEGRLSGPGVADNGAGLAGLLALAAAWNATRPLTFEEDEMALAPLLVANVGEEGEGNLSGMRYLCRAEATEDIRAFLVLDGPGMEHITSRALASRRIEVTITGPGGHSWRDSDHGNPVHALARAVTLFTGEAPLFDKRETANPRSSYNFGIFEGGSSINSIATEALAKVDLRSESSARIDQMAALLTTAVERAVDSENMRAPGGKVSARLREIGSRPSGELAEDAPILEALLAVDRHLGNRSYLDCSSTDANIPLSLGWPAVSIGAGGQGGGAHTAGEWYAADGREAGLQRVLLALALLLTSE